MPVFWLWQRGSRGPKTCDSPRLIDLGIPETAIPGMAEEAMKVPHSPENNRRPVSWEEAIRIYHRVF